MTNPIYVVGDIHGQIDMLQEALGRIKDDGGPRARVVFIGDYTDRGPDSRGVIDLLLNGLAAGQDWICLMGNHDRMFSMFMEDYPRTDARLLVGYHWLHEKIGGIQTLQSYGVEVEAGDRIYQVHARARAAVPQEHRTFLNGLRYQHLERELLFVHAGIRPGVPMDQQAPDDLIWIRDEFTNDATKHAHMVVHGHTHIPAPQHYGNRVNIDSGAGYGHALTAAVFEGRSCWVLGETGRVPLLPDQI